MELDALKTQVPQPRPRASWFKFPLRPDFMATIALIPVAVGLCLSWGIPPSTDVLSYLLMALIPLLGGAFLAVPLCFIVQFCRGKRLQGAGLRLFATLIPNVVLLAMVCWVYSHLKAGVLLSENVDAWLHEFDLRLCLGVEPWTLARDWIPSWCAGPLYVIYMAFLPVLLAAVLLLAMYRRTGAAAEMMCALLLGYNVGGLAYHVLPSYGPAFVVESADPSELSPGVASVQKLILDCVRVVQTDPGQADIQPWTYVGAFPSLHFSHVLIATWYLRRQRWACAAMGLFAVLTAISTVYFGWHYVADWFGGLFVAIAAVGLTELWSWARRRSETGETVFSATLLESSRLAIAQGASWVCAALGRIAPAEPAEEAARPCPAEASC